jgi:hypothetical protein
MYIPELDDMNVYSKVPILRSKSIKNAPNDNNDMSDVQLYFAYFSVYVLFPLLYSMFVSGNQSVVMILYRYITSGIFDTVSHIKEFLTDVYFTALRMFGQYSFSTYTVVKNGREIYSASSMYFYHKSDTKSVYRIDRAKYSVCKWIDKQCALYRNNHHEEPEVNETHNAIYDFILHKVDGQPYTRIHRGDFTGRTHTLITEHYRPFPKSQQIFDRAELTVYTNSTTVEPAMRSSDTTSNGGVGGVDGIDPCFAPQTFSMNLTSPHNFFLEKNEILDSKFLQWKLYNEFGKSDLANRLRSLFYNYKVDTYYNEYMKDRFKEHYSLAASKMNIEQNTSENMRLYCLNEEQSVIIGNQYIIKVDSILRCPVFESGEKQVFDIDSVLTNFYDCSDSDDDDGNDGNDGNDGEYETDSDDTDGSCISDSDSDTETPTQTQTETETSTLTDDHEFEIIPDVSE